MIDQIIILDFGSQYTQVIARRIRECNVYCVILPFNTAAAKIAELKPRGIILSGGPASVYAANAPLPDPAIFELGVPMLGICYGLQLIAQFMGGKVESGTKREYGKGQLKVTDPVPLNTSVAEVGQGGAVNAGVVTWNDLVNLDTGESTAYTFTVNVNDVASGTILTNQNYQVNDSITGDVYTTTVVDPILFTSKSAFPDPPGSNREMTYTLSVLNKGSLATDLVVTDRLPAGVTYRRGGTFINGQVTWTWPRLDTDETAQFTYTVFVGDVAGVNVLNSAYRVCSAEGACKDGAPLNSLIQGPSFVADLWLDPIAKKPGGGNSPVTPTMVLRNEGPGNALDATALMYFRRISVNFNDLVQTPANGQFSYGPECGTKCISYRWVGDLAAGETITFTTLDGQNSIGGEQGSHYTATLVITDQLGTYVTDIYSSSVYGLVTHYANLIPTKTAPPVIGAGEVLSYAIEVFNSGLSTNVPPYPVLTDTIPANTTFQSASDGGALRVVNGIPVVSWTLPALSTGDRIYRSFAVLVDSDLVSGTQIINRDYRVQWQEAISGGLSISMTLGAPVTTTVKEVGLIDSFKTVTPTLARPGPGNYLTYTLHVVNSSSTPLLDVRLDDLFPWEHSTYQRDAIATAGEIVSDIVSLSWQGDVGPFATELITFSVLVDEDFEGPITNTATITHPSLLSPVDISAVAYVTNRPVLKILKTDKPDPVPLGEELLYIIQVNNLGQQATNLVLTDTIPANTIYVAGSATGGGTLTGDLLRWEFTVLPPGESRSFSFKVKVLKGPQIVNDRYGVACSEGVSAFGAPVITDIFQFLRYLPITIRR